MNNRRTSYYIINGITMYRLMSAPILLLIVILGQFGLFKWLVAFSFLTDAIDGPLSRRFEVTSVFGARLDSVADDATVLISAIALWIIHPEFLRNEWLSFAGLLALFAVQFTVALIAYKKATSFHTYLAKAAAVMQALFFITIFFEFRWVDLTFYSAVSITALQLLEEIVLVIILPEWKTNVKGLYWVLHTGKLLV